METVESVVSELFGDVSPIILDHYYELMKGVWQEEHRQKTKKIRLFKNLRGRTKGIWNRLAYHNDMNKIDLINFEYDRLDTFPTRKSRLPHKVISKKNEFDVEWKIDAYLHPQMAKLYGL